MKLNHNLFDSMSAKANQVWIERVTVGLGYTAVTTSDGGMGLAATGVALGECCAGNLDVADFEGRPAGELLPLILSAEPMQRTLALALVNALNHKAAMGLNDDRDNDLLFDHFDIFGGARVAMVGYFPPLVRLLEAKNVPLEIIDDARQIGDKAAFYGRLGDWADVLLITATSILNNSTETILAHAGPRLKTVLLGPSTPMIPAVFDHLPIHMLAGSAIRDPKGVLKIVRHGGGTRKLRSVTRKVYWLRDADRPADDR